MTMKRAKTVLLPTLLLSVLPLLLVATLVRPARAASSGPKVVGVDYVLALMDAGIDQKEIIQRIEEKNLAFRLALGDLDRLREAGAGKHLIEVVSAEAAVLENHEGAASGPTTPPQDKGGADASQWGRPNRIGGESRPGAAQAPPASSDDQTTNGDEGIEEQPYGGYSGYGGYGGYGGYSGYDYWPGYYSFVYSYGYPYPYYYYPGYYYPYRSYYFSYPFYTFPHHSFRTAPRGGGSIRGVPRGGWGGGGSPRSSPRGGGSPRSAPRGSHH